MKVIDEINRVALEQQKWDDIEIRFKDIFKSYPKATQGRAFQREKLHFYETLIQKYKYSNNQEERLAVRFVSEQASDLERNLYKSNIIRIFRKAFTPLRHLLKQIKVGQSQPFPPAAAQQMSSMLRRDLVRAGFSSTIPQFAEAIKNGESEIRVMVAQFHQHNKRTDYEVNIKRDQSGNYQFLGFKASVSDQNDPNKVISQNYQFNHDQQISAKRAFNELEGRPTGMTYHFGQDVRKSMVVLDLNDKDPNGNYRRKEYPLENFDWKNEIAKLPFIDVQPSSLKKLEDGLMEGNREKVIFKNGEHEHVFFIQADPELRRLILTDDRFRKFSFNEVLSKIEAQAAKIESPLMTEVSDMRSVLDPDQQLKMTFKGSDIKAVAVNQDLSMKLVKSKRGPRIT